MLLRQAKKFGQCRIRIVFSPGEKQLRKNGLCLELSQHSSIEMQRPRALRDKRNALFGAHQGEYGVDLTDMLHIIDPDARGLKQAVDPVVKIFTVQWIEGDKWLAAQIVQRGYSSCGESVAAMYS